MGCFHSLDLGGILDGLGQAERGVGDLGSVGLGSQREREPKETEG